MSKQETNTDKDYWFRFCQRSNPKVMRAATDRLYDDLMKKKRDRKRRKTAKAS